MGYDSDYESSSPRNIFVEDRGRRRYVAKPLPLVVAEQLATYTMVALIWLR
jgi:hypothetical protein